MPLSRLLKWQTFYLNYNYIMKTILTVFLIFAGLVQADDKLSGWKSYVNQNEINALTCDSAGTIWAATSGGMFMYQPDTDNRVSFTNLDGQAVVNLTAITVDDRGWIISGGAEGILQFYDSENQTWQLDYTLSDMAVRDLLIRNDSLWVAAGNGLALFLNNGSQYVFYDLFINFPVSVNEIRRVRLFAGRIWLATEKGLLSAPSDLSEFIINDPQNWRFFSNTQNLASTNLHDLYPFHDRLWIATAAGLSWADSAGSIHLYVKDNKAYTDLAGFGEELIAVRGYNWLTYQNAAGWQIGGTLQSIPQCACLRPAADIWFGLKGDGLLRAGSTFALQSDAPDFMSVRYVSMDQAGQIWASSGRPKTTPNLGYAVYNSQTWNSYNFTAGSWFALGNTDVIYPDRFGRVWLGSWGGGAMFADGQSLSFLNAYSTFGNMTVTGLEEVQTVTFDQNTPLYKGFFAPAIEAPADYIVVTDIKEGPEGNLWFSVYNPVGGDFLACAPYGVDGYLSFNPADWVYFGADGAAASASSLITCFEIDDFGRIWIGTYRNGLYMLDYKYTISDQSDDQLYRFDINDNLYDNDIRSIAADQDGIIWIGTAAGLNSWDGLNLYRHIGDANGLSGPLNSQLNQIFVDNFNNKWFATNGGVSILQNGNSPWDSTGWRGLTKENSGLIDNRVNSVFVDNRTRQVVIGTENGISVYTGNFAGYHENYKSVSAGPNPFRTGAANSAGFVVKNLKPDSEVLIVTINGGLVRRLNRVNGLVDGSQAIWDGRDEQGRAAASGIYLFVVYDQTGQAGQGKIALIRN